MFDFFLGEHAGTDEKPLALRSLNREAAPPARNDVYRKVRELPILVLRGRHIELDRFEPLDVEGFEQDVRAFTRLEHSHRKTHGRAAVTAAP